MPVLARLAKVWELLGVADRTWGRLSIVRAVLLACVGGFLLLSIWDAFALIGAAACGALALYTLFGGQEATAPVAEAGTPVLASTPKEATPASVGDRDFLNASVTPEYLVGLTTPTMTSIQRKTLYDVYVGKWMTAWCTVHNVEPLGTGAAIIGHRDGVVFLTAIFNQGSDKVAGLPLGARVTVRGRVWGVREATVTLDQCELVDA